MSRTAVAILSTENLLHNLAVFKRLAHPAKVIAMVKANAYGHGIRSVALRLDGHVDMLGVASIDEAMALRKVGVKAPIMLAEGVFEPNELLIANTEGFDVVFHTSEQIDWVEKASLPLPLKAWVKINTGMGRLGFSPSEGHAAYDRLTASLKTTKPVRIMSHFACSDTKDHPLNTRQINEFQNFCQGLMTERSLCNTAGILNFPEQHYEWVRPGLGLYGVHPITGQLAPELGLRPVMTLQSSLISVQTYAKGATIGYGARYTCPEAMPIGVVALGYGDGYPITARDGTPVLVGGTQCSLVGRVSMDMLTVDLRPYPKAKVGDPVVLWGHGLPLEQVTEHTSNIPWNLITGVQNRVKFLWTHA